MFTARPPARPLAGNPLRDAVRSRNPSKSTLAHDAVATVVLHKYHPIICVGAGLIQFVYRSHLRLATEATRNRNAFSPFFARVFQPPCAAASFLLIDGAPNFSRTEFCGHTLHTCMNIYIYIYMFIYICISISRKWRKCNLFSRDGLCVQRHGFAINWIDRPRTSADESYFVMGCRRIWSFFIDLLFLREQSPWTFSDLDSCVLAYCGSAAPLLSLQSFYNYARGHCEATRSFFGTIQSVHLISVEQ